MIHVYIFSVLRMKTYWKIITLLHCMYLFLSRLTKREDSLLSCASDFLPITVFVRIRWINQFVFTNVYLPLFKYFSFVSNTLFDVWYFQINSESLINEVILQLCKQMRRSMPMDIFVYLLEKHMAMCVYGLFLKV